MQLLDGRHVSKILVNHVAGEVSEWTKKGIYPKLAIILVGEHQASLSYIKQKKKVCEQTGIAYEEIRLPENTTTETVIETIELLDRREDVHGILVQLPLPNSIQTPLVIRSIKPEKDVDGFHAYNLGKMLLDQRFESLVPCTPKGIIKLFQYYGIEVKGKEVVVVGHSNIVGKPMAMMLMNRNATVTVCHKFTKDLKAHAQRAEILIVAVGKAGLITADMVKPGAVVVDVGINRVDGKLVGDVDFQAVGAKASWITPVPGGCGPMTVACLMENVLEAAKKIHNF